MALAPKRRLGIPALPMLRSRRAALWVVGGMAVSAAATQLLPGGEAWGLLVVPAMTAGAMSAVADRDRREHEAERLHERAPRTADLDRAPAPRADRRRTRLRRELGLGVLGVALFGGATVAVLVLPDGGSATPRWLGVLVGMGVCGVMVGELRRIRAALRRLDDAPALTRCAVTVLGYEGPDVVVVPGARRVGDLLPPPGRRIGAAEREAWIAGRDDERDADLPPAFVAGATWGLGDLVPGDVLACDGELSEHAVVALATDDKTVWTAPLRGKPWREIRGPTFGDLVRGADEDADGGHDGG